MGHQCLNGGLLPLMIEDSFAYEGVPAAIVIAGFHEIRTWRNQNTARYLRNKVTEKRNEYGFNCLQNITLDRDLTEKNQLWEQNKENLKISQDHSGKVDLIKQMNFPVDESLMHLIYLPT